MKYLFILTILFSCSQTSKISDIDGVDLTSGRNSSVEISKSKLDTYGPNFNSDSAPTSKKRNPVVAINLYSTIYHSLAFVDLIKKLEKKQVKISMVSSSGFGSILAALYAKKASSSYLEWKLFELLKRLKGKEIYSSNWYKELHAFIKTEFKNVRMNQLKILFIVPETRSGKTRLNMSGKIVSAIKNSLNLKSKINYFQRPILYENQLKKSGADLVYSVGFLPSRVKFDKIDGFSWGQITKYYGILLKEKDRFTLMRSESLIELDRLAPVSTITGLYKNDINNLVDQIEQEFKNWEEENTSSLNMSRWFI